VNFRDSVNDRPNTGSRYLHLGCGLEAPAEWLNVDGSFQAVFARWPLVKRSLVAIGLYPRSQAAIPWPSNVMRLDLRRSLPFASNQFDAIYSSHTFEHLYRDQAFALASECCRVLKSNGICRVVVPDLEAAIIRYHSRKEERPETAADNFMDELLLQPRGKTRSLLSVYHRLMNVHQHKWMYDGPSLATLLTSAGFTEPHIFKARQGKLPFLHQIENPSRIENGAGVAVEVTKR
jgi:predicted SAM-dependent methyltransferase